MIKKHFFASELAYFFGLAGLALGTALMEAADFGVSMVVAPAYLCYLKLSQTLPFFTFGMAEYCLQALVLLLMVIVLRQFRAKYLFSFVTAVVYGFILDAMMLLVPACGAFWLRIVYYLVGFALCALGVALLFHTTFAPEAYELFVKEVSARFGVPLHRFKTIYDCVSCAAAVVLSLLFFGRFEGVKLGTIACAFINGTLIGLFTRLLEARYTFAPLVRRGA